ncbi:unnamed protein product [Vitrella brassicaformis CCMP3155]|uniref:Uncharacterized protein n=1 Tax=Vitrella brassicaformis (strain CCMP3155) TaxID=1169540 RepID=A0A0G4G7C5_VITBC|nr:unnamed protein product [Vitrella brassicaformis CCMP3155]|eukprot:CEM24572.1 unnamed protein product [Vitrella brassicaformis CCMP3155]
MSAPAAVAGDDGRQATSATAASDEDQRRAERERELRQTIADTPGLVNCITAFLPLYLLGLLSTTAWDHAAPTHTHLTIDSTDSNERSVWQRVPLALVTQWANKLTRLTTITFRYPVMTPLWCVDVFITVIEGHVAGRRAANMQGGSLRTITLEGVRLAKREMSTVRRRQQLCPDQIAPLVPPPSLDALTTITGLRFAHRDLASRDWRMPSLQRVEQHEWGADELGRLICSSQSLQRVGGHRLPGEQWAAMFGRIPKAAAWQRGPLAGLQSIGTIELSFDVDKARAAVDRLKDVLTSRGCRRSLTWLTVDMGFFVIDSSVLPLLQSVESLHSSCCRVDAEVVFEYRRVHTFDLSLFYSDDFPPNPSPLVMNAIQAAAQEATQINYTISQHSLTHPVDSPSQAAIDIVKTLTFDNVTAVIVRNAPGFVLPPNAPSPHPAIIDHLQPLPTARQLFVDSALGGAAGRLLAEKMPREVELVDFGREVSSGDRIGVLEGLGAGRAVGGVNVVVSLTEGALDGWGPDSFPSIGRILMRSSVPDGLEASAAAKRIRDGISSIVDGVRGLERLTVMLYVDGGSTARAAIQQLLTTGTKVGDNFIIDTHETERLSVDRM